MEKYGVGVGTACSKCGESSITKVWHAPDTQGCGLAEAADEHFAHHMHRLLVQMGRAPSGRQHRRGGHRGRRSARREEQLSD